MQQKISPDQNRYKTYITSYAASKKEAHTTETKILISFNVLLFFPIALIKSMKVSATSHLAIRNRVALSKRHLNSRGRTVTTTSLAEAPGAVNRGNQNTTHESIFSGVPGTMLSSTSSFRARIKADSLTKVEGDAIKFNITNTGTNSRLVSSVWWFDRIVVFGSGGPKN